MYHFLSILKRRHGLLRLALLLTGGGILFQYAAIQAVAGDADPVKLKAALVYKLTRFVHWPGVGDGEQQYLFDICVMAGEDVLQAFGGMQGRKVGDREIQVRRVRKPDASCRLLYIGSEHDQRLNAVLNIVREWPLLSVSDLPDFARRGGIIELARQEKRMRFFINHGAARRAGLTIAAPLMEMSTVVDGR